jgi:hypothetical protein
VGTVIPESKEIVQALARARGETLMIHGAEAVLRLGLTPQVPVKPLFYTSGPSRSLQVGKQEVVLKHASLRMLSLGSGPAGLACSALCYMGKNQVTPDTLVRVQAKLSAAEFTELRANPRMPGWLSDVFHRFEQAASHG